MAESGTVQAVVIVSGVFAVVFLCSIFKSRPRPEAFTGEQLDEIRIRREAAKEASIYSATSTTTNAGYTMSSMCVTQRRAPVRTQRIYT